MSSRSYLVAAAVVVLLAVIVGAIAVSGGDDGGKDGGNGLGSQLGAGGSGPANPDIPIAGRWRITETVIAASADCAEDIGTSSSEDFEISEKSGELLLTGYGGQLSSPWPVSWDPTSGTAGFAGDFDDEGGVTSGVWTLKLSGDSLAGTKDWTWKDKTYSCVGGQSTIEGSRK